MRAVWVVVPAFNEAANLREVIPSLAGHLTPLGPEHRILVVDDGSSDGTQLVLAELESQLPLLRGLRLRTNRGKAAALRSGFLTALEGGATHVVMMDADGQDDPSEIPRLLEALDEGAELVTGARTDRQDRLVKRVTSRFYNRMTGAISRAPGEDFNSGFKAMKADVAHALLPTLYGELHRYITVVAYWRGFAIREVSVVHHPRRHGKSKYGVARFWRGLVDLVTIRFLMSYEERPSHFFSGVGALTSIAGAIILLYLLIERLGGASIGERPLLTAGVLLFLSGLQLVIFGLLAELVVYRSQRMTARPDEH